MGAMAYNCYDCCLLGRRSHRRILRADDYGFPPQLSGEVHCIHRRSSRLTPAPPDGFACQLAAANANRYAAKYQFKKQED